MFLSRVNFKLYMPRNFTYEKVQNGGGSYKPVNIKIFFRILKTLSDFINFIIQRSY